MRKKAPIYALSAVMSLATVESGARLIEWGLDVKFNEFHNAMTSIDDEEQYATTQFKEACGYLAHTLAKPNVFFLGMIVGGHRLADRFEHCQSALPNLRAG